MAFFIEIEQSYLQDLYGTIKDPEQLKWFLRKKNKAKKKKKRRRAKLKASHFLVSNYITKLN